MEKGVWLEFEKIDETFANYGLWQAPLKFRGQKVPFKAIIKEVNGKQRVISIVGRGYRLVPNLMVHEAVVQLSEMFGLEMPKREGHRFVRGGKTAFEFEKNRAYWTMVFPEKYDVGKKDPVQLGVQVRNSEDASMGFGIDLFTWRIVCSNGAVVKTKDLEIKAYWKHTKHLELDIGKIKNTIIEVLDRGRAILDNYRALTALKLNQEIAERLADRLPKRYLPEYIKAKQDKIELLQTPNLWETYNDITRLLWHSEKTSMFTKRNYYGELHKALAISI